MLFAGHGKLTDIYDTGLVHLIAPLADTTSNTLDSAIGFLALYQDVQEEIYEEIKDAVTGDPNLVCGDH